jgi:hypothetical protein
MAHCQPCIPTGTWTDVTCSVRMNPPSVASARGVAASATSGRGSLRASGERRARDEHPRWRVYNAAARPSPPAWRAPAQRPTRRGWAGTAPWACPWHACWPAQRAKERHQRRQEWPPGAHAVRCDSSRSGEHKPAILTSETKQIWSYFFSRLKYT